MNQTRSTQLFVETLLMLAATVLAWLLPGAADGADEALPKQGSYSITFPWHFQGQAHEVGEKEIFATGLAWGPALNDAKRGFLDNTSVKSIYNVRIGKDASLKLFGNLIVVDSDGHKAFAVWEGVRTAGTGWAEGTMTWTGGTGKYQGLTGQAKWKQRVTGYRPSGSNEEGEGYTFWKGDYRLP